MISSGSEFPALLVCVSTAAQAECVTVKYRKGACVPLEKLDCKATVSSFINQLCYDEKNGYMLLLLKETWYHYCDIPKDEVNCFLSAELLGRFYNQEIKGKFGCQGLSVPTY